MFCVLLILNPQPTSQSSILNVSITLFITLFITSRTSRADSSHLQSPRPSTHGYVSDQETRTDHDARGLLPSHPDLSAHPSSLRGNVVSSFNHHEAICSSIIPFRRIGGSLFARFYRTCKCSSQQRISSYASFLLRSVDCC